MHARVIVAALLSFTPGCKAGKGQWVTSACKPALSAYTDPSDPAKQTSPLSQVQSNPGQTQSNRASWRDHGSQSCKLSNLHPSECLSPHLEPDALSALVAVLGVGWTGAGKGHVLDCVEAAAVHDNSLICILNHHILDLEGWWSNAQHVWKKTYRSSSKRGGCLNGRRVGGVIGRRLGSGTCVLGVHLHCLEAGLTASLTCQHFNHD